MPFIGTIRAVITNHVCHQNNDGYLQHGLCPVQRKRSKVTKLSSQVCWALEKWISGDISIYLKSTVHLFICLNGKVENYHVCTTGVKRIKRNSRFRFFISARGVPKFSSSTEIIFYHFITAKKFLFICEIWWHTKSTVHKTLAFQPNYGKPKIRI